MLKSTSTLVLLLLCLSNLQAQKSKKDVLKKLDGQATAYGDISQQIWEWAEVGYQEEKSSALLQKTLQDAGFTIEAGIAGIPTAFVAEYGTEGPVLAVLGEFDALPGLSQQAVPEKQPADGIAGHACGHNLFGTASVAAAIAVKDWLIATNTKGKIRFYGTPAEEGGSGKVYMVREGVFDDVDVALHWHPGDTNNANPFTSMANKSAKFRFTGISAHAAGAPERGRSALDGVESMDLMVNMMREHIPQDARIHYVITSGGKAPNVVPDYAEVYYYARHFNRNVVIDVFDRIVKAAEGAALGTGTTMEYEMIGGTYELLPNLTLQKVMYDNLVAVGGFNYSDDENVFGEQIVKSLGMEAIDASKTETIQPYQTGTKINGSTDIGDVSFVVPTIGMIAATFVPGTPGHSWQAVAAGGTSIGKKGMMVAAKTIALTAIDIYKDQKLIEKAKIEFEENRGKDFKYVPLLGNRPPALDYRK
ncbi:amidohydrolase [Allomuricauda sp. NBRC 101325]|uniref:amidohydrolase n=1 Tax=Allomuricauda sp. NBRC 101325 TaxID=1113758 RepID=UPI0024A0A59D|nr:amidohydrolase [Muricauda sp. NBRC 101325]GLU44951.1 glutamate carboxypeptidase [Muricauda sp. NBRC 101325]